MTIPQFPSFIPLVIEHGSGYREQARAHGLTNADLSFPELFAWRDTYRPFIAQIDNSLCIKLEIEDRIILFPPLNKNLFLFVKNRYIEYLNSQAGKKYIGGLTKEEAIAVDLQFEFDRDNSDYVYKASDLADLPGTKYHAKKNLVRQFQRIYHYRYEPLNCDTIKYCLKLSEDWCNMKKCSENADMAAEEKAIKDMLMHCKSLELFGGVLYVENKITAFTVASILNQSMVAVHAEKADTHYKGAYQTINQLFVKSIAGDYQWINRESDAGNAGLRKAKLSYYPAHLIEKYYINIKS